MGDIIKTAYDVDHVLEEAKGVYDKVLVIGFDKEDGMDTRASFNLSKKDALWLIEHFKYQILSGEV